jgi:hypothetical protein
MGPTQIVDLIIGKVCSEFHSGEAQCDHPPALVKGGTARNSNSQALGVGLSNWVSHSIENRYKPSPG